jgi:hypothetical protein
MNSNCGIRVAHFDPNAKLPEPAQTQYALAAANTIPGPPLHDHVFTKLSAERDITPETASSRFSIGTNGSGLTNLFRLHLTQVGQDRDTVDRIIRDELNLIFGPDGQFEEILVLEDTETNTWEIYLREVDKKPVAISQLGSGLKM